MTELDPFLTVKYQGPSDTEAVDHQILMSAGLLRRLVAIVQSIPDITAIYADVYIQEIVIVEVCKPRPIRGKEPEQYTLNDFIMTPATANQILAWVSKHVMDFFTDAAERVKAATAETGEIKTFLESLTGLVLSQNAKQSAGPTDAAPPEQTT